MAHRTRTEECEATKASNNIWKSFQHVAIFEKFLFSYCFSFPAQRWPKETNGRKVGPTRYRFAQSVVPNRASGQGGLSTVHTETVPLRLCLSRPFYSHSARIISNYITTAITSRRLRSALVTTRSNRMQKRKHVINFILYIHGLSW